MTYNDLVTSIKDTVDAHLILKDFGYGALSDIKTVDEDARVNYPYAFLNPGQSTRTGQTITYRFNLIVMDTAQEDPTNGYSNYLKVQSDCQQYIDDILANLRFSEPFKDFDLTLNMNLTPFKERFQDTVAGMTATLEIELPIPLDNCVTPFAQLLETIPVIQDGTIVPYNYGNLANQWDVPGPNAATYKIVWDFYISQEVEISLDPVPNNKPQFTIFKSDDEIVDNSYIVSQEWDSRVGVPIRIRGEYVIELQDAPPTDNERLFFGFGYADGVYPDSTVATEQLAAIRPISGDIKIYKL
jgi:hypothetical protein